MHTIRSYLNDDKFKFNITNKNIYIDNYNKIENLTETNVTLKFNDFIIAIEGKDFIIKKLIDKEILFTGEITNIKFIRQ